MRVKKNSRAYSLRVQQAVQTGSKISTKDSLIIQRQTLGENCKQTAYP